MTLCFLFILDTFGARKPFFNSKLNEKTCAARRSPLVRRRRCPPSAARRPPSAPSRRRRRRRRRYPAPPPPARSERECPNNDAHFYVNIAADVLQLWCARMAPTQNARIKTAFVNTVLANAFATVTCTHATPSRVHSQPLDVPHFIGFSSARNAGQCRTYCKNAVRFVPEGCMWKTVSLTKVAARTSRACATGACGTPALLPCCYWNSLALTGAAASKGQARFATRKP